VSGVAPDSGRTNVKTRAATGVDDFGSRLTASPLNVAVKAFVADRKSKFHVTNVGASPNAASLFPTSLNSPRSQVRLKTIRSPRHPDRPDHAGRNRPPLVGPHRIILSQGLQPNEGRKCGPRLFNSKKSGSAKSFLETPGSWKPFCRVYYFLRKIYTARKSCYGNGMHHRVYVKGGCYRGGHY